MSARRAMTMAQQKTALAISDGNGGRCTNGRLAVKAGQLLLVEKVWVFSYYVSNGTIQSLEVDGLSPGRGLNKGCIPVSAQYVCLSHVQGAKVIQG